LIDSDCHVGACLHFVVNHHIMRLSDGAPA
jgi:hypothetical protein